MTRITAAAESITGRRSNNEDAFLIDDELGLFTVADGMGGYAGGEIASSMAVSVIHDFVAKNSEDGRLTWPYKLDDNLSFGENLLRVAIRLANQAIRARCKREKSRMGTTVVAIACRNDDAVLAHVGDSRIYRLSEETLERLTRDHSFANQLKEFGSNRELDKVAESRKHIVTRALGAGADDDARPELQRIELQTGDRFLLCSDGIHDVLSDEEIESLLRETTVEESAEGLTSLALESGSKDNITAMVLEVG